MSDDIAMAKAIDALRPWRDSVVIVGGWAHQLYRRHPDATLPPYRPIVTRDADVAFDSAIRLEGDIAAALDKAGFQKVLKGDNARPISHFQFGAADAGFLVEFLTPLRGRGTLRDGSEVATMSAAGVTAQKLRHLDVLLLAPWRINLAPSEQLPLMESTYLSVANPASFIVQKLLIHHRRVGRKKAQDLLYVHDTLDLFAKSMPALNSIWSERIGPSLTRRELRDAKERADLIFRATTDTIRDAVRIPVGRRIDPNEFRLRCKIGLELLLGLDA